MSSSSDTGSENVIFTVSNARRIKSRQLFALVDVEMQIVGVSFVIFGVQARNVPGGGTSIHLPTYKNTDGKWRAAIELPEELAGPLTDAVLEFLMSEGLATWKYASLASGNPH